jgi:hypothetical protein
MREVRLDGFRMITQKPPDGYYSPRPPSSLNSSAVKS